LPDKAQYEPTKLKKSAIALNLKQLTFDITHRREDNKEEITVIITDLIAQPYWLIAVYKNRRSKIPVHMEIQNGKCHSLKTPVSLQNFGGPHQ
jgi:hypothetical protein